jgi:3'-5' exonuclease
MGANVIVWDMETVPDLKGFAAANHCAGKTDDEIRAAIGTSFPSISFIQSFASAL